MSRMNLTITKKKTEILNGISKVIRHLCADLRGTHCTETGTSNGLEG